MNSKYKLKDASNDYILSLPIAEIPEEQEAIIQNMSRFASEVVELPENVVEHLIRHCLYQWVNQHKLELNQFTLALPQERYKLAQDIMNMVKEIMTSQLLHSEDIIPFKISLDRIFQYYIKNFGSR